ncbi:MAG: CAP domain-containing protein [Lachnospiraceae bacterium]|nr:CAP domain-containing protein [Lachnospiraceae bacterium]
MKNILKKSNFLFLLFFALFLLLPHEVKAEDASTIPVKISVTYGQTEARRIFRMINDMRTSPEDAWYWCGREKQPCPDLKPLQYDYDLEQIAMRRAAEIALSFSHARPNGKLYYTAYDILLPTNSENIAAGSTTAEGANRQWREDDANDTGQAHRRTMLSDEYNCVGIAHVTYNGYHYWVEEFACRPNVNTQSTAAVNTAKTVTLDVKTTKIENFGVVFNQDKYLLKKGKPHRFPLNRPISRYTVTDHTGMFRRFLIPHRSQLQILRSYAIRMVSPVFPKEVPHLRQACMDLALRVIRSSRYIPVTKTGTTAK